MSFPASGLSLSGQSLAGLSLRSVRRALWAIGLSLPLLFAGGGGAFADSFSFSYGTGFGHRHHQHRHFHHRHHHHRSHGFVVFGPRYHYAPPPVVVRRTVVVDRPVVAYAPSCTSGLWRQGDGSMVEGVACRQPDGSWRLE